MLIELQNSNILFLDTLSKRRVILSELKNVNDLICYNDNIIILQDNIYKLYNLYKNETSEFIFNIDNLITCYGNKYFAINNKNNTISIFNANMEFIENLTLSHNDIIAIKYNNNTKILIYKQKINKNKYVAIVKSNDKEITINHPSEKIICLKDKIVFVNNNIFYIYTYDGSFVKEFIVDNFIFDHIKPRDNFLLFYNEHFNILLDLNNYKIYKIPGHNRKIEFIDYNLTNYNEHKTVSSKSDISIVLVCHPNYIKYLENCINSIDGQTIIPDKKILILDNIDTIPDFLSVHSDWLIKQGFWGSPNPARNLGLELCNSQWVCFFDSDNIMPFDYIEKLDDITKNVNKNVAFIYPKIIFDDKIETSLFHCNKQYWNYRISNNVDTASVWKTSALKNIGGWHENIHTEDDYYLVLELTSKGWSGHFASNVIFNHISHIEEPGRWVSNVDKISEALWEIRSIDIVIDCNIGDLFDINKLNTPNKCTLYLLNYGRNNIPDFLYQKFNNVVYSNYNIFHFNSDLLFTINLNDMQHISQNMLFELSSKIIPYHVFNEYIGGATYNNNIQWSGMMWNGYFVDNVKHINISNKNRYIDAIVKNIYDSKFKIIKKEG